MSYKSLEALREMGKHLFFALELFADFQIINGLHKQTGKILHRWFF